MREYRRDLAVAIIVSLMRYPNGLSVRLADPDIKSVSGGTRASRQGGR